jgi:uncharacterized protein YwgA/O-acetyl-ADP-ribose deacetylase (regulator of RNase III)
MVRVLVADLFASKAQTLVNTVNTVGVMGKGIALEFRKRFPDMYEDYVARCRRREVRLGQPYLFRTLVTPWILNFPTKDDWRSVSRLSDIIAGLEYLERHYHEWGITSLAVPPLGCGQGQLEWRVVGRVLYQRLGRLNITVELYAPQGTPAEEIGETFLTDVSSAPADDRRPTNGSRIEPAWVALVEILARIVREPYHWPVGRTTFQKIAYFATEEGLPTGLRYQRGSYGPFTPDLKRLVTKLVNNGLLREQRLGQMFSVLPGVTYNDAARLYARELANWEPIIERIADLFLRMRTQQAEVAATVHFAARALAAETKDSQSEQDVLEAVRRWKQKRRPPLEDKEIGQAIRSLNLLGWVKARPSSTLPLPAEALQDV